MVSNILMSLNTFFEFYIKSIGGIGGNLLLKKGRTVTTETLQLVTIGYEDDSFSS